MTGLVLPLSVPAEILDRDLWWMLGATVLLLPLMKTEMRINRIEGAILLAGYIVYTALLIQAA